MRARRRIETDLLLCAGPGRLCQALAITSAHDGLALDEPPFELRSRIEGVEVIAAPRVGISRAVEKPWRYGLSGSRYVSRRIARPRGGA
jgi:DNA-3-methyladenine glycosylase